MDRFVCVLVAAALAACAEVPSQPLNSVVIEPASAVLNAGDTLTLTATVRDQAGNVLPGAQVEWGVSDTTVVVVTQTGLVTARAPGAASVGARSGVGNGQAIITVVSGSVATLRIAPDSTAVDSGASRSFVALVTDSLGNVVSGASVAWQSSNPGVLAVSATGVATGLTSGNALVIASSGGAADTATVAVVPFALRAVSVDSEYTCATSVGLAGYCWGRRVAGVLGTTTVGGNQPLPGAIASDSAVVAITSGGGHSCALTPGGTAICWGDNSWGQLGIPSGYTAPHATPAPVQSQIRFTQIAAGWQHTCGLTSVGYVYCWGRGDRSQLGGAPDSAAAPTPRLVAGVPALSSLTVGADHACGLTAVGIAYCWGDGHGGALGNGDTVQVGTPTLVSGSLVFISLSAGADYTCGVTTQNVPFCWGHGIDGQLGTGHTDDLVPTRVQQTGGLMFAAIAAGGTHTCALTTAGAAYCWGRGTYGALGTGTAPYSSEVPVAVTGGVTFAALAVGLAGEHTCGVTPSAVTHCWGYNLYGQVGDGTTTNQPAPTRVAGQ
jgi:alpha-tubulin suppressor-like RCC1 family protein